ncbi:MAG: hypothetical protein KDB27_08080 [Planctomycetales bacterium]|nr:hypothetical protein [Planctomycetales bacterium]
MKNESRFKLVGPRRWLRFSLATSLAIITVVCVWLGVNANRARQQRRALAALDGRSVVRFDFEIGPDGKFIADAKQPQPAWALRFFGEDFFRRVHTVDCSFRSRYPLGEERITDQHLHAIQLLPYVETLEIGQNPVTDKGLANLRNLKYLRTLYLYQTEVKGSGLVHLSNAKRLENLSLARATLTDDGLTHIASMKNLKWLQLALTQVTDAGTVHLAKLPRLELLDLGYTDVSDETLHALQQMKSLRSLNVVGTSVTAEGVRVFQEALPECAIYFQFGLGDTPVSVPELASPPLSYTHDELKGLLAGFGNIEIRSDKQGGNSVRLSNSLISDESGHQVLSHVGDITFINVSHSVLGDEFAAAANEWPDLALLRMVYTRLTDAGVSRLTNLQNLVELDLSDNAGITDASVPHLIKLRKLNILDVRNTRITVAGIRKLKKSLPDCNFSS